MADALPFLKDAEEVEILTVTAAGARVSSDEEPACTDHAAFARAIVAAQVRATHSR